MSRPTRADMPVAMPSPVHEGEIEEGEMVEGEERDQEDENEIPADETRGVEDSLSRSTATAAAANGEAILPSSLAQEQW